MPSAEHLATPEQQIVDQFTEAWESHYREQLNKGMTIDQLRKGEGGKPAGEEYDMVVKHFGETIGYGDPMNKINEEILDRLAIEKGPA